MINEMQYNFELPEIIIAERTGRCVIKNRAPKQGEKWQCVVECSAAGAAALAAIRHADNLGAECEIVMLTPLADANSSFSTMLEVAGCMDMPVSLYNNKMLPENDVCVCGFEPCNSVSADAATVIDVNNYDPADAWNVCMPNGDSETLLHNLEGDIPLYSCSEIRAIDASAMEEYGLPGVCLMENAGIGACAVAVKMLEKQNSKRALIIAGRGNNGGDAFVVARGLAELGFEPELVILSDPSRLRGDAAENFDILEHAGFEYSTPESAEEIREKFPADGIIIDGMLGTGLKGNVRGLFAECIEEINKSNLPVLSLDIPSGLDADSGKPLGCAVKATETVTFAAVKQGFATDSGLEYCGDITLADIGAPAAIFEE